ncbi:MAG: endolytic transglycosylase MltG [Candidatus Colwellbacteria bacterium]|nr:endolytic transglycosylase MltG [Candidatus Colwellbacteria bacterium]
MRQVLLLIGIIAGLISIPLVVLGAHGIPRLLFGPETTEVTIPEGMRVAEINILLKEAGVLRGQELSPELEGYLFPDTYEFFLPTPREEVEAKLVSNFNVKVKSVIPPDRSEKEFREIIIAASLIEKEVPDLADRKLVSGIIWKRLSNNMPLQVDWTICYLKGLAGDRCLPISETDKKIDSPYNTYLYPGLPPGPISNPGLDAIEAALLPAHSDYWYYLSDPKTNQTIFARTLDEHNQNIIKYLSE